GADLLGIMRERGETAGELAAGVRGLLSRAQPIDAGRPVMDIVGTGGSGRARYNASTTACFVLAAAGVPIAKHGNRGSARPNGSFDLLEALGIPFQLPLGSHRELLESSGMCFIFARQLHPAVAAAAPFRKLAAARVHGTIFNLAGPLANPARPRRMLIGSARPEQAAVVAETVAMLGTDRTVVVCGHPGIDEVSVTGPTQTWEVSANGVRYLELPTPPKPLAEVDMTGGDAADNAKIFHRLIDGAEQGALLDYIVANAGAALATWRGVSPTDAGTRDEARTLILSGAARQAFVRHRRAARKLAGLPQD
ncbi:MAG: anthranilate phosphoribosyltransferase, partial [Planctomycetota bacterium]